MPVNLHWRAKARRRAGAAAHHRLHGALDRVVIGDDRVIFDEAERGHQPRPGRQLGQSRRGGPVGLLDVAHHGPIVSSERLRLLRRGIDQSSRGSALVSLAGVVADAPELEHAVVVTERICGTHVAVEWHADAARIDQRRAVRAGPVELQVTVAEDDGRVRDAGQHPFVIRSGLGREALDVGERRPVDVQHAAELLLRLEGVQPALVSAQPGVGLQRLHHIGSVERRLAQPAFAVATNPGRVRQPAKKLDRLLRPRRPRAEVTAEQVGVDASGVRVLQHLFERGQVAVDVVQSCEHGHLGSHT